MGCRIGIASWLIGKKPLSERIRWIRDNGFTSVSLEGAQLAGKASPLVTDDDLAEIRRTGLDITIHLSPGGVDAEDRRKAFSGSVTRSGEIARSTGRVYCISIDPAWKPGPHVTYDPERTLEALQSIAAASEGTGARVAVENWKINPEMPEFARLADELTDVPLGLLLDLGHLHVMNEDTVAAMAAFPIPVYEVHVSDNDGRSDDHLPLGKGTLPIDGIAAELDESGFDGIWTVEMRPDYYFSRCCISRAPARKTILSTRARIEEAVESARHGASR